MISNSFLNKIKTEINDLKNEGLYKSEYQITSQQSADIEIFHQDKIKKVINFCANNYLGLANNEKLIKIGQKALDSYGLGTASVRFICGTQDINKRLEERIASFLGYEDAITFSSCFAANNGIFAALFDQDDAIISADLNHASLIDGIRLSKAARYFYKFDNMSDLELQLQKAQNYNNRVIVTDGVFSMDGDIAKLEEICDLADKYNALLLVDDCHATGVIGANGRGSGQYCNVEGRIDILTSTLGKALGGTAGGFIASKKEIIDKLRNKARPYLFSNNISPVTIETCIEIIDMIENDDELITKLTNNTNFFRVNMIKAGFDLRDPNAVHPVIPVMLRDAKLATHFAKKMIEEQNIYVVAFSYPVVPKNEARIRVQISAAHEQHHLEKAIHGFKLVGKELGVIN